MGPLRLVGSLFALSALALGITGCGAAQPAGEGAASEQVEIAAPEPGPERERERERQAPRLPPLTPAEFEERIQMLLAVDDAELVLSEIVERYLGDQPMPAMFGGNIDLLVHLTLGPALGATTDLSRPMAIAIGGSGDRGSFRLVFGIELERDAVHRLGGAFDLHEIGEDVYELIPFRADALGVLGGKMSCVVTAQRGDAPYLVCGDPRDELPLLAPHLAAWIAGRERAPVVALELSSSFMTEVLDRTERRADEGSAGALGRELVMRWFASLEKVVLRGELLQSSLSLEVALHQRRGASVFGALFLPAGSGSSSRPPEFDVLPADTMLALSLAPRSGEAMGRLFDAFAAAIREEQLGEAEKDMEALLGELRTIATSESPVRLAFGLDEKRALAKLEQVVAKAKTKSNRKSKQKRPSAATHDRNKAHDALEGWFAMGLSSEVEAWNGIIERIVEIDEGYVRRTAKMDRVDAPALDKPLKTVSKRKLIKVKKRDRLPEGAVYLRIDKKPNPKWEPEFPGEQPAVPSTRHLVSASGRGTTWLVSAPTKKQAFSIARSLATGEGQITPAMRQCFRPRGLSRSSAVGFVTPLLFDVVAADGDYLEDVEQAIEALRAQADEPGGGRSPLPLAVVNEPGGEGTDVVRASIELPDSLVRRLLSGAEPPGQGFGGGFEDGFKDGFGPLEK